MRRRSALMSQWLARRPQRPLSAHRRRQALHPPAARSTTVARPRIPDLDAPPGTIAPGLDAARGATRAYGDMIHSGRTAFPGAPSAGLPEGGAPVTAGGRIAGAIGVSGVESGPDARLARAAYKASRPDPRAFSIPREESR
ncbi:TPA: heme-binding protein [Burkholderia vietnamiensis]|nr:heme-binding protein [Burkholderia vietnamiensis]